MVYGYTTVHDALSTDKGFMTVCRNISQKTLLLLLLLIGGVAMSLSAGTVNGERRYYSRQLFTMARTMGIASLCDNLGEGTHYKITTYNKLPLTIIVSNGEVCHIGYSVFTPMQRKALPTEPLNFIERYALLLDVPTRRLRTLQQQLEEDKVMFTKGSFKTLPTFINDTTFSISLQNESSKCHVLTWNKDGETVCQVFFPLQYELLAGMPLEEIEQGVKRRIMRTAIPQADTLQLLEDSTLLPSLTKEYYLRRGDSYYFAELNSNKYYEKVAQKEVHRSLYRLLFNHRYRRESLANILTTTDVPNNYRLKVKQRTYNYTDSIFEVPLTQWISFCINEGCTPYFALISEDGNTADCELVMNNWQLGYNHVMRLKVDISDMDSRSGLITARLNAYIPTHNIKYLFKEQNK